MEKKTKKKYIIGILWRVYDTVRWLVIIAALLLIILFLCGIRPYIVRSGSMEPAITTGSICFVNHNAEYADVKNGDIITFKFGADDVATHRAVSVGNEGIHTKGDANENEDAVIVTEELFVGKTIWHIPEVGYLITVLRSRNGLIMTVAFIVFFLLIGRLLESLRDNAEKESESKKNE